MPRNSRKVDVQRELGEQSPGSANGARTQELATAAVAGQVKRTEPNLLPDEQELRRIIDLIAQTIVVLNPAGRAIYANRVTLEYTGLSLDEVRADNFRDRVFHPEGIQRLREARHKGLSGTVPFENEQRALGKDGYFCGELSEQEQKLVWATQGVPKPDLFEAKVGGTAWKAKPSWYIVGKKDHTVNPDLDRAMAKRMGATTYEFDSSHVPMLSQPERVLDVIRTAAQSMGERPTAAGR